MNNDIPPLAPDDKPFDFDEDKPNPPFYLSKVWIAVVLLLVVALIAGLASPIFAWW